MRYRRIIYLALGAFLIIYLFNNNNLLDLAPSKPATIKVADIIKDFGDLSDNPELTSPVKNENGDKYLYVPLDYTGQAGEVFYLVADDAIYKYKIELPADSQSISYSLKDTFNNIVLPETKFTVYDLNK